MTTRRKSALRTQILSLLRQHHLLSAPQLVERLRASGREVNKTSVYRALDILAEDRLVTKKTLDSEAMYEVADHHHDHIVCTNCGAVESVDCVFQLPELPRGYTVEDHTLTLYGRCPNCR